ncbi:MAG: PEP-CTERM sorting domain-containing protein [Microcystis aeruginosa W13-18]|nr:PEP-CTERM sorting domain-containing protein [Microcystis aeruginosa W13-18]NCR35893.1 PEP-CTERM sorting domain-containing protein [Microcystis aeruginosa S11-05]NCR49408.1 PEP-CTERM sorting domain-containing protein [Microcystis aeruginosa S11-01]
MGFNDGGGGFFDNGGGITVSVTEIAATPVSIPEPTSTLGFLALGTLGAASTLKRQIKSSKSTEKETTKVG